MSLACCYSVHTVAYKHSSGKLCMFSAFVNGSILHVVVDIIPKKIKYSDYLELVKKGQQAKSSD